jgi:hypothetical protein
MKEGGRMSLTATLGRAKDDAMQHFSEAKVDRMAKENDELKMENRLLREELSDHRSEHKQVLDMLEKARISDGQSAPTGRRFKLLRLIAVGGTVYAIVTKTGAVDRVKAWIDSMRGTTDRFAADVSMKASDAAHGFGDKVEHAGRRLEQTGDRIEQVARPSER